MNRIPCPKCYVEYEPHEIDKRTGLCFSCTPAMGSGKSRTQGGEKASKGAIAILFVVFIFLGIYFSSKENSKITISKEEQSIQEGVIPDWKKEAWIEKGHATIRSRLKDPQSAQFRNSYFNMAKVDGQDIPVTCGQVNSKNSFGGYSGYQRFIAAGSFLAITEEDMQDFNELWGDLC